MPYIHYFYRMSKVVNIGILGGGQLGRMLLQAAANYPAEMYVLEKTTDCPCAPLCKNFRLGDIRNYDDVVAFGQSLDVITIEIEHVNTAALQTLKAMGKKVFPDPDVLQIIQDKGLQKQFYARNDIQSPPFVLTENRADTASYAAFLPAAHKLRKDGYDGKGVKLLRDTQQLPEAFDAPSLLEKLVDINRELAVIVARSAAGEMAIYPVCEMVFNPEYNLVDYLISPADIPAEAYEKATQLAVKTVEAFQSPGIYAVELFMDKQGEIWVNEVAPRAHNSGHASIEGNFSSQYDMQMRLFLGLPLGDTAAIMPSLMFNLIGAPGHSGSVHYIGLEKALQEKGVYVHLYGKSQTAAGRKMGHVTLLHPHREQLITAYQRIKDTIQVISS